MHRLRPHSLAFTFLLGALATLASFATDMGLPVLDEMAASLHVGPGRAALSLSVFMAGFALGPLIIGPVSDHVGRRPVLLTGCAMFATFGALAAGIAPIIAPTLGVAVATMGGWRAIYGALAAGATVLLVVAALRLGESLPQRPDHDLDLRRVLSGYGRVLRHRISVGYILVAALNFGCLFAYVTGSSLVLIGLFGVSRRLYGLLFAATSLGLMVGAFTNATLSRRGVAQSRLVTWGLVVIVTTSLLLLAATIAGVLRVWLLVPLAVVGFMGQGIVRPNAVQGALEPMPEIAGVASAVMSATQMFIGAVSSALVAAWFDGRSAIAVTAMMALAASASAMVYITVVRAGERTAASTRVPVS